MEEIMLYVGSETEFENKLFGAKRVESLIVGAAWPGGPCKMDFKTEQGTVKVILCEEVMKGVAETLLGWLLIHDKERVLEVLKEYGFEVEEVA